MRLGAAAIPCQLGPASRHCDCHDEHLVRLTGESLELEADNRLGWQLRDFYKLANGDVFAALELQAYRKQATITGKEGGRRERGLVQHVIVQRERCW